MKKLVSATGLPVFVRASPVGFATGMYELRYAFSLAGLMGARPLPEFNYLIYLTSGFAGLGINRK